MSVVSGWLIPLLVGAATGVLSGFGVGGGTLLLVYMTTLAGLVVVLMMVVQEIASLFDMVKTLFRL